MQCVFDNPVHANDGCIFADPTVFLVSEIGDGLVKQHTHDKFRLYTQATQEDEELIIIARAFIEIISCRH